MKSFYQRYIAGEYEIVWDELCLLGPEVRKLIYFDDATSVAHETMRRVRSNCEVLVMRLQELGWRFGYEWASIREAEEISKQPRLLGDPVSSTLLDIIETNNGLLPISLRAFYEFVGCVNFVGTPFERPNWPAIADGLDPLYICGVEQAFNQHSFMALWPGEVEIAPDFLHKYFISGVGSEYIQIPATTADAPVMFEDGALQVEGRDLTLVRYLRYAMKGGGFLAFMPDSAGTAYSPTTRPEEDLAYLTQGLLPI